MSTIMEDEIKKFDARGRRKVWTVFPIFFIFSGFAVVLHYFISEGNVQKYRDFYLAYGVLILIAVVALAIVCLRAKITYRKQLAKFDSEQLRRMNREAAKAPKLEHILVTQDAIGYHMGMQTILVPVSDIIRISRVENSIYHAETLLMPTFSKEAYIYVYTRDGKVHRMENNLRENLQLEVYAYLAYTVCSKRPGVLVDDPSGRIRIDITREELIRRVDAGGTEDAGELEMQFNMERIYKMCCSDVGNSRWTEVMLILIIMATYIVCYFLFRALPDLVSMENALQQDLFVRMGRTFGVGALMALPVILVAGSYLKNVLFDKERIQTRVRSAIYMWFGMVSIGAFAGYCLMAQDVVHGVEAWKDWKAYKSGNLETAEGELYMTDAPVEDGVLILTEKTYGYINGANTCYSYYAGKIVDTRMMQDYYKVTYTPNLRIITSLTDAQGYERVGLTAEEMPKLQKELDAYLEELAGENDVWRYGDCIIEKHPFVYGYEELSEGEQMDFDILYGEKKQEGVETTRVVQMPKPLSGAAFKKLNKLYECNRMFESYRHYQYMYENEKVYVSRTQYSEESKEAASETYHAKAEKIIKKMPENLREEEKIEWVAGYLLAHVKVFDYSSWREEQWAADDEPDTNSKEYQRVLHADSGYGALVLGVASEQGYMEAFGMLLEKAGVYSIAVVPREDSERSHCWNLVKADGKWKAVNVYQMAGNPSQQESFYLISNKKMESLLETSGCYGGNEDISLPK